MRITLAQAARLCDIQNEYGVYLRASDNAPMIHTQWVSIKCLRDKLDWKTTQVTKIAPFFSIDGFEGLVFTVPGLTEDQIFHLAHY